ncbi:serpin family protein [Chondromyces crocatus]|uniref:Serine (Or cysteine) proteinase inhibitor, cladeB (Ovalbumin), member n=1 Tax=Chondromyces crocatus TaxID=52 RepID=A0A0K1ECH9_CHOCO|nr:serpin family protein [Chondromyces crocatus]AKT38565.1 serine (or cysteine) proteinase inhibitor, cladeB (ovalbumin), member [Chondromyces crocatus]
MRFALCLLPLLAVACGPSGTTSSTTDTTTTPTAPSATQSAPTGATTEGDSPSAAPRPSPPTEGESMDLAASSNAFATDLYAQLRTKEGNLAFSPASITLALTMTWGGAKGETASQMAKVLHLTGGQDAVFEAAGKQLSVWNDASRTAYTLRVANRLFGEKTFTFEDAFLKKTATSFSAPLEPTDFASSAKAPETARARINGWVEKETQDRIKNLIPSGVLDTSTRLVLVNAIYFLGSWVTPFPKASTRPAPFHGSKGAAKDVPTMNLTSHFKYAAVDGLRVLELPYKGDELSMTLVLPDDKKGLPAVEKQLTADKLSSWIQAASRAKVNVALPQFELSPSVYALRNPLSTLGMPDAFDERRADFTGIANPTNPSNRLLITQVLHKAFVKVDEQGTEAAAATGVIMGVRSAAPRPEPIVDFHADHPFLFFIRDVRSGMILFVGRVEDPAST